MNLNIEQTQHESHVLIKVGGEIDVYTAPELEQVIQPIVLEKAYDIHFDLSNVSYLDSTGLGLFVGTLKSLNKEDKALYIYGVNSRIERLFDITGLKELMHVNEQVGE